MNCKRHFRIGHGGVCNPSTWEAEARGLRVQVQLGLHSETLFQKKKMCFENY
jgi:hypothetical protein